MTNMGRNDDILSCSFDSMFIPAAELFLDLLGSL